METDNNPISIGSLAVLWGLKQNAELNNRICRVLSLRETEKGITCYEVQLLVTNEKSFVMLQNLFQIAQRKVVREKDTLIGLNLSGRYITGVKQDSVAGKSNISAPCRIEMVDNFGVKSGEHFKDLIANKEQFILGTSRVPLPMSPKPKPFFTCGCMCQLCLVFLLLFCIVVLVVYALLVHFEGDVNPRQSTFSFHFGDGNHYQQEQHHAPVAEVEIENYYKVLGITKNPSEVTTRDINEGYQKASRKYHPDKNRDPSAAAIYANVREAYDVLKNPRRRAIFEAFGINDQIHAKLVPDHKGEDIRFDLQINLSDLYTGATHSVSVARQRLKVDSYVKNCQACKRRPPEYQRTMFGLMQVGPDCRSTCQTMTQYLTTEYVDVELDIEKGMHSGDELRFPYMGSRYVDYLPSDLVFTVSPVKHKLFRRHGRDLHMDLSIPLVDAILGFSTTISHLDSHRVTISTSEPRPHGTILTYRNEGMPTVDGTAGNLLVTLNVEFPKVLSEKQKADLIALFTKSHGEEYVAEQLKKDETDDENEDEEKDEE
eukprot:TRINITY_DN21872_c0_g1_i1.p1 TRINITY_DN21872_c0_g1~~TRINITY_DN21872_c0_g1_i1.p1  ORF type:complete len:543 (+),score=63.09 TRINITY_DN21872_c0_g1_i1:44-1672(+)